MIDPTRRAHLVVGDIASDVTSDFALKVPDQVPLFGISRIRARSVRARTSIAICVPSTAMVVHRSKLLPAACRCACGLAAWRSFIAPTFAAALRPRSTAQARTVHH